MTKPLDTDPLTLVIFGIAGDLSHRKLLPSLYYLTWHGLLPEKMRIVGAVRDDMSVEDLLSSVKPFIEQDGEKADPEILRQLGEKIALVTMDLTQADDYSQLQQRLEAIDEQAGACMNRLFYMAVPAQLFGTVVENLGQIGLNKGCDHGQGYSRLLIEKPFGYDLASAKQLIKTISQHFSEEQIYRIDHYLAKETAQNILTFRFQNPVFRRIWDRQSIKGMTITVAESIGIENRVGFYEHTGALRDIVQSHMLQLLALATMEEPRDLSAAEIHKQKAQLLAKIQPITPGDVNRDTVRGQYDGYHEEVSNANSHTETFAALRLSINDERWQNVPILLRTGKALQEKMAEISVIFTDTDKLTEDNRLTIRIQPDEGISLELLAKKPGFREATEPVYMDFDYKRAFHTKGKHPDAYDYVLVDALRGDKTLFATDEEVLASWQIIDAVVQQWTKDDRGLESYAKGSWGPPSANSLAENTGLTWPTENAKSKAAHN